MSASSNYRLNFLPSEISHQVEDRHIPTRKVFYLKKNLHFNKIDII